MDDYLVEQIVEQKARLAEDYLDQTCKLEKGKAYPDFRRLKRLAKRYGVYKDAEGRYIQATTIPDGGTMNTSRTNVSSMEEGNGEGDLTERARHEDAVLLGSSLRQQIERKMGEMNVKRKNGLEEGRTFIEQINWDSQRMMTLMESEKTRIASDLKSAWDRDTHVRNVLKLRRKMLKKGGFVFKSKPPTPSTELEQEGLAGKAAYQRRQNGKDGVPPRVPRRKSQVEEESRRESGGESGGGTSRRRKQKMVKVNLTATQTAMVPEDMSVGYDMRTAR